MKTSNVVLVVVIVFFAGFIAGLFWASQKGSPPGIATATSTPQQGQNAPTKPAGPTADQRLAEAEKRLAEVEKQVNQTPNDFRILTQAGRLAFESKKFDKAIEYYTRALDTDPNNVEVITDLGIMHRRVGRFEKAIELFTKAMEIDPTHENSSLNMGIVYFHDLNDKVNALKVWKKYLALNPQGDRVDLIRRTVQQLESDK